MADSIFTFRAKLSEFFRPDHPDATWLLRLAVLRDDLAYELERVSLSRDDPPEEVWRCAYTLRKLAITISEVKNIFSYEVQRALADQAHPVPQPLRDGLKNAVKLIEEADAFMQPIRDGLGAHVRPSNATQTNPKHDPTPAILRAHGDSKFEVRLDMQTGRTTSLRQLTAASFLFAWPDVVTEDDYYRKQKELRDKLFGCFDDMVHGIDALLYRHWTSEGLVGSPQ